MTTVHVVVPDAIDDPTRPSGGNVYDRRVCDGLRGLRWDVREHPVPGSWPRAGFAARTVLADVVARIPDGSVVVVDGLIGSAAPDVLLPEAGRLRLVLLVHMPLGTQEDLGADLAGGECAVLSAAAAVVVTSRWTSDDLVHRVGVERESVHIAEPGADAADLATGTSAGTSLLCVAALSRHKGHDLLLSALAQVRDRAWTCRLVGSLAREPSFVRGLRARTAADGIDERVDFAGPLVGADLEAAYSGADLLVLASYAETYGMVVTEALARGVPVVATSVGGVPEALGHAPDGTAPGLLVPAGDLAALAASLRRWLEDDELRHRLRAAARGRRTRLGDWSSTTRTVAHVLSWVAA